jgi:exodeoxyribonuclease VII small subunit
MSNPKTFEEAITQLEQIVSQLETGALTLEESVELYEQGMKAALLCEQKLHAAEQKIEIVTSSTDKLATSPFEVSETEEGK